MTPITVCNGTGHSMLICPTCSESLGLHQRTCVADWRFMEDGGGLRTVSRAVGGVTTTAVPASKIEGRSDAITIGFECENCHKCPTLVIMQNKGYTQLKWVGE